MSTNDYLLITTWKYWFLHLNLFSSLLMVLPVTLPPLHRQELEDEMAIMNERVTKLGGSISIKWCLFLLLLLLLIWVSHINGFTWILFSRQGTGDVKKREPEKHAAVSRPAGYQRILLLCVFSQWRGLRRPAGVLKEPATFRTMLL